MINYIKLRDDLHKMKMWISFCLATSYVTQNFFNENVDEKSNLRINHPFFYKDFCPDSPLELDKKMWEEHDVLSLKIGDKHDLKFIEFSGYITDCMAQCSYCLIPQHFSVDKKDVIERLYMTKNIIDRMRSFYLEIGRAHV